MMKRINKEIKKTYPGIDIEAVAGNGYVYFIDNTTKIPSCYFDPKSVNVEVRKKLIMNHLADYFKDNEVLDNECVLYDTSKLNVHLFCYRD